MSQRAPATPVSTDLQGERLLVLTLFFLSGFLGLAYEVTWIRKASLVFGSATLALSTVVAVFFGGLALGSAWFGRRTAQMTHPLRLYAKLEIALGVFVVASPLAFGVSDRIYGAAYDSLAASPAALSALRAALLVVLLLPAAFLMGGTLPLIVRQFVTDGNRIAGGVGFLYGWNTLGAALGALATGFVLLPAVGGDPILYLGGVASALSGFLVARTKLAGRAVLSVGGDGSEAPASAAAGPAARWVPILFFLSGFVVLANEILWTRFLGLLVRNTVYTYSLTLAVILFGIVLGSLLFARRFDRSDRRAFHFGLLQVLFALTVALILQLPASFWQGLVPQGGEGSLGLGVAAAVLLLPALLAGASFPLAIRMVVEDPRLAGLGVGRMTAVNTVGGILGSLLAGFLLLPAVGLQLSVQLATALSLVGGAIAWFLLDREVVPARKAALLAGAAVLWIAIPFVSGVRLPEDFLENGAELVELREGKSANLAVLDRAGRKVLEIDGLWQGEDRKTHQIMAAHLPLLLHPEAKDVVVVGMGTGQTASRFLMHDVERMTVVDIEPELDDVVRGHFEDAWLDDPRCEVVVEDGRSYLRHVDRSFDVISIEVGQTFRPGVGSFYRPTSIARRASAWPREESSLSSSRSCSSSRAKPAASWPLSWRSSHRPLSGTTPANSCSSAEWTRRRDLRRPHWVGCKATRSWPRTCAGPYWGGREEWLHRPEVFLSGFLLGPAGLAEFAAGGTLYRDDRPELDYAVSSVREPEEAQIVQRLLAILDPFEDVLPTPGGIDLERAAELRRTNLSDLGAASLGRWAWRARTEGDLQTALVVARKAVTANPRNARTQRLLGDLERERGNEEKAMEAYREALRIDPDDASIHERLANSSEKGAALAHLEEILRLDPTNPSARVRLGRARRESGDVEGAIKDLQAALELDPDLADAHYQLGLTLTQKGENWTAMDHYARVIELRPDFAEAYVNQAILRVRRNELQEALALYEQAVDIAPELTAAHYNRSLALRKAGRFEEAETSVRRALELDPDLSPAYDHLGTVLMDQERFSEAVAMYERALELSPGSPTARSNLELARRKVAGG